MTRRDLAWRAVGIAMIGGGCLTSAVDTGDAGTTAILGLVGFTVAIAGLVLALQGKRVPLALRIERSRHRELPMAIWRRRHTRRGSR